MLDNIDSVGIIGSADGPTSVYISKNDGQESEVLTTIDINNKLNSMTKEENFNAGFKIMCAGMVAVFAVLTILYIVIKIMGRFATGKEDKNDKN